MADGRRADEVVRIGEFLGFVAIPSDVGWLPGMSIAISAETGSAGGNIKASAFFRRVSASIFSSSLFKSRFKTLMAWSYHAVRVLAFSQHKR